MQANDITRERLRRLAETRPANGKVLSLFLNLDPREFGTAPARSTEIRSMLDRASRQVRDDQSLTHDERVALRADLERLQSELADGGLDLKGAHGVAVFASSAADLFEVLKLAEPVDHDPVIADTPFVAPLTAIGAPERWCVVLVNRRTARLLCGTGDRLQEVALIEDDVHRQHDQGGWSQANYQRSVDKEAFDHLKRTAEVTFARLKGALPAGILVGAPQELVNDFEGLLHPYLRERLAGRIDIDVEHSSAEDVRRCARERIEEATRAKQDAALARLAEAFGGGPGSAASGPQDVGLALEEQRVEILLVDAGFEPEGAIERALAQSADVYVLRDRPELASHGHIAAVLRF
jgi:peptide chain release factor subunit 1